LSFIIGNIGEKAMSLFYIEPRYNSGERVAGGKLAIYESQSSQRLCDLYRVADFGSPAVGTSAADFLIDNPINIDNNGINNSPIFLDLDMYPEAYYRIYDAKGAELRGGYVLPMSWHGGGHPQGANDPFGGSPAGDPFWGYQVVSLSGTSFPNLINFDGSIGRPLFLAGQGTADRSGGIVLWCPPNTNRDGDNILSFTGKNRSLWIAREKWINYSYLALMTSNPFQYIDNLNTSRYQYSIDLDEMPRYEGNADYCGKLRISKPQAWQRTNSTNPPTVSVDWQNLEIAGPNLISTSGSGSYPFAIYVNGGEWNASKITDSNGNFFVKGDYSALVVDKDVSIRVESDINYKVKSANGHKCYLTGTGTSYHIEPAFKAFVPDNTVKATNAEFYSNLAAVDNNVGIASNNNIVANNLLKLGNDCAGTVVLDAVNSHKLYVDSAMVNVTGKTGYDAEYVTGFYLKEAGKVSNAIVLIDRTLGEETFTDRTGTAYPAFHAAASELAGCQIMASATSPHGWKSGKSYPCLIFLGNANIRHSVIENHMHRLVLQNTSIDNSRLHGKPITNQNALDSYAWNSVYALASGSSITNSECHECHVGIWAENGELRFGNIHFDGNKANECNLSIFYHESMFNLPTFAQTDIYGRTINESLIAENVTFKGNERFKPYLKSEDSLLRPFIKGHVEITGYYDYSGCRSALPTEKLPPDGENINFTFSQAGDYLDYVCLYNLGDPTKYIDRNGITVAMRELYDKLVDPPVGGTVIVPAYRTNLSAPRSHILVPNRNGVTELNCYMWNNNIALYRIRE